MLKSKQDVMPIKDKLPAPPAPNESTSQELEDISSRTLVKAIELANADAGILITINNHLQGMYCYTYDGNSNILSAIDPYFFQEPIDSGVTGDAIRKKAQVYIKDTDNCARWQQSLEYPYPIGNAPVTESTICTPIIHEGDAIGCIIIRKIGIDQFSKDDQAGLFNISAEVSKPIADAVQYTQIQRQLDEAELFNRVSATINASLDIQLVLTKMLDGLNELLAAEAVSVAEVDGNELVFTASSGAGDSEIIGMRIPVDTGVAGWAIRHREPAMVNNPQEDERFNNAGDDRTGHETYALISAPLVSKNKVLGTLTAINPVGRKRFTMNDLRLMTRLANLASNAIANAQEFQAKSLLEERYSSLFEDNVAPILLTDTNGVITDANLQACLITGFQKVELIGMAIGELHNEVVWRLAKLVGARAGEEMQVVESEIKRRNQPKRPVEIHIKHTKTLSGSELQWMYHDISERVELDSARRELTAMLVHDLQNPLGNVLSSLELLEGELEPNADVAALMLDIARRNGQRLHHLIASLLDIERLEAGTPIQDKAKTVLNDIFDRVSQILGPTLDQKRVALIFEADADLPIVYVNADMIERVLINLIDNATKFSRADDTILVQAWVDSEAREIRVGVLDEGPGIAEKHRAAIFGKFYRGDTHGVKGIGLGLSFCKLAVTAHGGQIWVDEAPGGGAAFYFTVPIL